MGRRRQPPEAPGSPEPQDLRSTTRAIAWTALFFALVACALAGFNIVLTWRDGQLVRNFGILAAELSRVGAEWRASAGSPPDLRLDQLRERVADVERLAGAGDDKAAAAADRLIDDMARLKRDADRQIGPWLDRMSDQLRAARDRIASNAPEAARLLRALGAEIQRKVDQRLSESRAAPTPDQPDER
jgi:hypothetical protein